MFLLDAGPPAQGREKRDADTRVLSTEVETVHKSKKRDPETKLPDPRPKKFGPDRTRWKGENGGREKKVPKKYTSPPRVEGSNSPGILLLNEESAPNVAGKSKG